MSVVAQSPFTGKRLFEDDCGTPLEGGDCPSAKRARCLDSPGGRRRLGGVLASPATAGCGPAGSPLCTLKVLFPGMDDRVSAPRTVSVHDDRASNC